MTADKWMLYFNVSLYGVQHVIHGCWCFCLSMYMGVWLHVYEGQRQTHSSVPEQKAGTKHLGFCALCVQWFGYWRNEGQAVPPHLHPECFWNCARHQEALPQQELEFLHVEKVWNCSGIDESVWGTVLPSASCSHWFGACPFFIISFIMSYK